MPLQGANVYDSHPSSLHGPHYLHPQPKEHFSRMDLCPHSMASLECQLYQSMEFCQFCYYVSSLPWTGLEREWLNENSIVNFMQKNQGFLLLWGHCMLQRKGLRFEDKPILVRIGASSFTTEWSWANYPVFLGPLQQICSGNLLGWLLNATSHFLVIALPIFTCLMW